MGKNAKAAPVKGLEYPEDDAPPAADIKMVNLFLSNKQEEQFRKWEEQLKKKLKTDNTTDTVFKALEKLMKLWK
jgi:hypothetical protein